MTPSGAVGLVDQPLPDFLISIHRVPSVASQRSLRSFASLRYLLNETFHPIAIGGDIGGQNLLRDFAIELCVLHKIHLAHPARADLGDNALMSEVGVDAWRFAHLFVSLFSAIFISLLVSRNPAAKLFEPIHDHIDLPRCGSVGHLHHDKPLAIRGDVVGRTENICGNRTLE